MENMTSKNKAKELVYKFGIQYALLAVDLRLDADFDFVSIEYGESSLEYWQEVKKEIENLAKENHLQTLTDEAQKLNLGY